MYPGPQVGSGEPELISPLGVRHFVIPGVHIDAHFRNR